MTNPRCTCGGGRAHHENDIACWCPRCLQGPDEQRCTQYAPHKPVKLPKPPLRDAPSPENDTDPATQPNVPTYDVDTQLILEHLASTGNHGATSSELSTHLGVSSRQVARSLTTLEENQDIRMSRTPRVIGDATEMIWVATRSADGLEPHQVTLWA